MCYKRESESYVVYIGVRSAPHNYEQCFLVFLFPLANLSHSWYPLVVNEAVVHLGMRCSLFLLLIILSIFVCSTGNTIHMYQWYKI